MISILVDYLTWEVKENENINTIKKDERILWKFTSINSDSNR